MVKIRATVGGMRVLVLLIASTVLGCECEVVPRLRSEVTLAEPAQDVKLATLTKITDKRINESSGLAASRLQADSYYTHNDSGDRPRFFRFNHQGVVTAEFSI